MAKIFFAALALFCAFPIAAQSPDLIIINARIYTGVGLAEGHPQIVEAIAIRDGKVQAIGTTAQIKALADPHTIIRDLARSTEPSASANSAIFPGLNDAHCHLGEAGQVKLHIDLTGTPSLAAMLTQIATAAKSAPAGHWLTGGNWDHTLWAEKILPTRQDLDRITGDHPTFLDRIDGHISIANSAALTAAGITGKTTPPEGGAIDLDPSGNPTGILRESAQDLVYKVIPPPSHEERIKGAQLSILDALSHGVTSTQDFSTWQDFLVYEELEKSGQLNLRISEWLPFILPVETLVKMRAHHDANDPMLHTGMLKGFMDGSLGSRTAAMKAPFADDPKNSGLPQFTQDELNKMIVDRAKLGFQIGFHAIGDRGAAMALEAFSQTYDACPDLAPQDKNPYKVPRCWPTVSEGRRDRIEHAQIVDPADMPLFKKLGIIASLQPDFLLTDMNWALERLGPVRAAYSYDWKSFLDAGIPIAFGTDYPVEPITPFRGLYAAVTRKNEAGTKSFYPEKILTRGQALAAYTQGSAYAEFKEKEKGLLLPGYYADLIHVDRDLYTVDAPAILKTVVLETIVNGKIVYQTDEYKK